MRSSSALVGVCIWSALACTPTEPDADSSESIAAEPAEPEYPPIGAWVVIDLDEGRMFKTTTSDIEPVTTKPSEQPNDRIRIAEVTAIVDGFIEVRTIAGPAELGCASAVGFERDYELTYVVRLGALQPVLARPKQFELDGGTKLELAAGVPVIETGAEGRIRVGQTELVVDVAEQDVGLWFTGPTSAPVSRFVVTDDLELYYGERSFVAEWDPFRSADERIVAPDGRRLLTFVNACGRFVLAAKTDSASPYAMPWPKDAIPNTDSEYWGCNPPRWMAPIGAKLSWRDGGRAGVVLTAHQLPDDAKERGDRVCFEVSGIEVCITSATLERTGDPACKPAGLGLIGLSRSSPWPEPRPLGQVRMAKAEVSAGLDRYAVRRIVRAHINELRSCYSAGLDRNPKLAGRIVLAFEISATGKVSSSSVKATTLEPVDETVTACFAEAVERWTFPVPDSSAPVSVVYPFQLSPS